MLVKIEDLLKVIKSNDSEHVEKILSEVKNLSYKDKTEFELNVDTLLYRADALARKAAELKKEYEELQLAITKTLFL